MRKFLFLAGALFCVSLAGCNGCRNTAKSWKSSTEGIKRTVVLYDGHGKEIQRWKITSTVNSAGCDAAFLNEKGGAVRISGTYVIEEQE